MKKTQKPNWRRHLRLRKRRRGTALVETPQGILLVSENGKKYDLPGGAAKGEESRRDAALRELEEETGLKGEECTYLFDFTGRIQRNIKGGFFKDAHEVFLIKTSGTEKPQNEIQHITYTSDPNVNLSFNTRRIIEKYAKGRGKA